ncbi:hypothetical protein AGR1B_pa0147 [Agrobacterium fabacearum S56]|nr:hypothetical protein AGR1B_pa0147 [Agrobacterium fabacearum S56]
MPMRCSPGCAPEASRNISEQQTTHSNSNHVHDVAMVPFDMPITRPSGHWSMLFNAHSRRRS